MRTICLLDNMLNRKPRCGWAKNDLAIAYHDAEWGVPIRDDRTLFEFLILEGAQAGLSWDTVLAKRDELLQNAGIIRNRLKIASAVRNAKCYLQVVEEFGSFDKYIWSLVGGKPIVNAWENIKQVPASTAISDKLSADLKQRGFNFVGSTIMYAFMQACGLVNDHLVDCFRYNEF